jgi:hypothetical protein
MADRERVVQALSNLVDNAIKFSPRAGSVTVTLSVEGGDALFAVDDDGPGITAEHLPHVFDRFWKAEVGGKQVPGSGSTSSRRSSRPTAGAYGRRADPARANASHSRCRSREPRTGGSGCPRHTRAPMRRREIEVERG